MADLGAANLVITKARPVESLAARARRKGDGPSRLPDWAAEPGALSFIYAVGVPDESEKDFSANVTFRVTHANGGWAISVIVNLTVGVVEGSAHECAQYLRDGNYDTLGIAAWPDIRHAVRLAAYSIDARVQIPSQHPYFWRDAEEPPAEGE